MALNAAIANVTSGNFCLCPFDYGANSVYCPNDPSDISITISEGQAITIVCEQASGGGSCTFGCSQTIIRVHAGAKLILIGNDEMVFTGGTAYSRMYLEAGAEAHLLGVTFKDTAVDESTLGKGGGIESYGVVFIMNSAFENCSASSDGGAIYGFSGSNTTVFTSTFSGNSAKGTGSAIYSDGYVYIEGNTFANNTVGEGGQVLGGNITLEGCQNSGLAESKPCNGGENSNSTNSTAAPSSSGNMIVASMAWAAFLAAPAALFLL